MKKRLKLIRKPKIAVDTTEIFEEVVSGKMPSDKYFKEEVKIKELKINEHDKLIISVKRGGDLGLPHIDIRHYTTTKKYTGYTKRGINIPLDSFESLMDNLVEVEDECFDKKLFEEFKK